MTAPGRVEAGSLPLSPDPPPSFGRSARAVAEVVGWPGARIEGPGTNVDRRLEQSSAPVPDVGAGLRTGHRAGELPHGEGPAVCPTLAARNIA